MGIATIGFAAGALTTLSFLPQVVHSARRRNAAGFSWLWLLCFGGGISAWIAYGVGRGEVAIIWPNSVTLVAVLFLMWLRVAHGRADTRAPQAAAVVEAGGDSPPT